MKTLTYSKLACVLLAIMIFVCSCASTTMLHTEPSGAKVYVDGQSVGTTPYAHTDKKTVLSSTHLTFKMEGYQDYHVDLVRDEQVDVGPAVVGFFFLWPVWLWVMKYDEVHTYELQPVIPESAKKLPTPTTSGTGGVNPNAPDELIKLKALLDDGTINEEDFSTLKVKILNGEYDYNNSAADQLTKLKKLFDSNLLTREEFSIQKKKVVEGR
jgi:hypothetical protein